MSLDAPARPKPTLEDLALARSRRTLRRRRNRKKAKAICASEQQPPKRDPFAGEIRKALGEAKARRGRVTLAMARGLKEQDQAGGRS